MDMKRVIKTNKIQCNLCLDIIESPNTHKMQFCKCGKCAVDGGKEYLRRIGNEGTFTELSEYE